MVGVAPVPGYVWFGGYWNWVGGRHVWDAGSLGSGSSRLSLGTAHLGPRGRRVAHGARTLGALRSNRLT